MATIAKVGKTFLIGSGVAYPIQRGILKVSPKLATKVVASKKKSKVIKKSK